MRIVTWNCQMGLDKKIDALLSLRPDVAVIPESSQKATIAIKGKGYRALWFGSNPRKGLAVICRRDWEIRTIQQPEQQLVVPIEVLCPTPFRLIAVWACLVTTGKQESYIGQVYRSLIQRPEWFEGGSVVVAGDLNSNAVWDGERLVGNHSEVVNQLANLGIVSAYHLHFKELQGKETRPTFYFYRRKGKPFHIDHVLIPTGWMPRVKSVEVGEHKQWCAFSDHCPVTVEVED